MNNLPTKYQGVIAKFAGVDYYPDRKPDKKITDRIISPTVKDSSGALVWDTTANSYSPKNKLDKTTKMSIPYTKKDNIEMANKGLKKINVVINGKTKIYNQTRWVRVDDAGGSGQAIILNSNATAELPKKYGAIDATKHKLELEYQNKEYKSQSQPKLPVSVRPQLQLPGSVNSTVEVIADTPTNTREPRVKVDVTAPDYMESRHAKNRYNKIASTPNNKRSLEDKDFFSKRKSYFKTQEELRSIEKNILKTKSERVKRGTNSASTTTKVNANNNKAKTQTAQAGAKWYKNAVKNHPNIIGAFQKGAQYLKANKLQVAGVAGTALTIGTGLLTVKSMLDDHNDDIELRRLRLEQARQRYR